MEGHTLVERRWVTTMVQPRTIDFDEFALHLRSVFDMLENEHTAIVVERAGRRYRVELEGDRQPHEVWAGYDVEQVRLALRASTGALKGINREELLADIHAQRGQESHGRPAD